MIYPLWFIQSDLSSVIFTSKHSKNISTIQTREWAGDARHVERHTKKSFEASRRCKICGMYYEGDELVCLFCGGLVDAPIESDSGDSNPDGWRFSHSFFSFFFLFFFSLLLCFSCRVTCPTVLLLLMSCNLFVVCIG